MQATFARFVV